MNYPDTNAKPPPRLVRRGNRRVRVTLEKDFNNNTFAEWLMAR